MKISVYLEENVLVGKYQSVKVGVTLHSDIDIKGEQVDEATQKLWDRANKNVQDRINKIKEERGITNDPS
jgi:hypothetical protein